MLVKTINILPAATLHNNGFKLENIIDKYPNPHFMRGSNPGDRTFARVTVHK